MYIHCLLLLNSYFATDKFIVFSLSLFKIDINSLGMLVREHEPKSKSRRVFTSLHHQCVLVGQPLVFDWTFHMFSDILMHAKYWRFWTEFDDLWYPAVLLLHYSSVKVWLTLINIHDHRRQYLLIILESSRQTCF